MVLCNECGANNPKNAKFCKECGKEFKRVPFSKSPKVKKRTTKQKNVKKSSRISSELILQAVLVIVIIILLMTIWYLSYRPAA
jgi:uncharacterized membrane protein YvbJ